MQPFNFVAVRREEMVMMGATLVRQRKRFISIQVPVAPSFQKSGCSSRFFCSHSRKTMGSSLSNTESADLQYEFFNNLSVASAEHLISSFGQSNDKFVSWKVFYRNAESVQLNSTAEKTSLLLRTSHPATYGFALVRQTKKSFPDSFVDGPPPSSSSDEVDFYTDDSASQGSMGSDDDISPLHHIREDVVAETYLDSSTVNPIYFGYEAVKMAEFLIKEDEDSRIRSERCQRALINARKLRTDAVTQMEQRILVQRSQREKKMNDITVKYSAEIEQLKQQLEKETNGVPDEITRLLQVCASILLE